MTFCQKFFKITYLIAKYFRRLLTFDSVPPPPPPIKNDPSLTSGLRPNMAVTNDRYLSVQGWKLNYKLYELVLQISAKRL